MEDDEDRGTVPKVTIERVVTNVHQMAAMVDHLPKDLTVHQVQAEEVVSHVVEDVVEVHRMVMVAAVEEETGTKTRVVDQVPTGIRDNNNSNLKVAPTIGTRDKEVHLRNNMVVANNSNNSGMDIMHSNKVDNRHGLGVSNKIRTDQSNQSSTVQRCCVIVL